MFMRGPKQKNFQREIIPKFKPIPKILKIAPLKNNPLHAMHFSALYFFKIVLCGSYTYKMIPYLFILS